MDSTYRKWTFNNKNVWIEGIPWWTVTQEVTWISDDVWQNLMVLQKCSELKNQQYFDDENFDFNKNTTNLS